MACFVSLSEEDLGLQQVPVWLTDCMNENTHTHKSDQDARSGINVRSGFHCLRSFSFSVFGRAV